MAAPPRRHEGTRRAAGREDRLVSVYIEYISRKAAVPLEGFHAIAGPGQAGWAREYGEDRLILNVGRTWRLGPEPEYMCVWDTPGRRIERLGEWAQIFSTGQADHLEKAFDAAARIDVAGLYEPLLQPVAGDGPLYYGEFFDLPSGATPGEVTAFFQQRRQAHGDLVLNLLADRIGKLGPDPRGIAFWQLPSYEAIEAIAIDLDAVSRPIELVRCGLYADIGREIL
jgi:hypothetical protein